MSSRSSESPPSTNAVQPYRMHVSQKYLDLTKQKLELVRLPRDPRNVQRGWEFGVSKSQLEPLIDHWLEEYNWRAQETLYNDNLPQFRVPINGTRLHFVHKRSSAPHAVPLLFVHGWPESFISASKMIDALCNPITTPPLGDDNIQAFHVVVPSIPGFGFSDPIPESANNLQSTAEVFQALMQGLGYRRYVCHGSGWGFKICRAIAIAHPESCMAIHTVNPDVPAPRSSYGYTEEDMIAMSTPMSDGSLQLTPGITPPSTPEAQQTTIERPQTSAYALCDSPSGLLAHVLDFIRPPPPSPRSSPDKSPEHLRPPANALSPASSNDYAATPSGSWSPQTSRSPQGGRSPQASRSPGSPLELQVTSQWTPTALITWTMIYWLPGPEVALRWLTNSTALVSALWAGRSNVPLGISFFRDASLGPGGVQVPPQWAEAYHRIAMVRRREGRVRFPAWERPGDLVVDLREFVGLIGATP